MKIFDRFLMTIFIFAIIVLSIILIILSFGLISVNSIMTVISNFYDNWPYSIIGAILILACLKLLFYGNDKNIKASGGLVTLDSKYGAINISYDTIINLAERQVRKIDGVKSLNIYASKIEDKLHLTMDVTVSPDLIIPDIIKLMQKEVKDYIENTTSIYIENVKVNIINLNSAVKLKVE